MPKVKYFATFCGDNPAAAQNLELADRREIALVAMERARTPMVVTDPRQTNNPIIFANQAFMELTGFEAPEIIGKNCRFLQGPDTSCIHIAELREALQRGDDRIEIELVNYRKDGTSFLNSLLISAIRDDEGQLLYYYASQEDVTVQRKAEQLETSERRLLKEVDHRTLNALTLVQSIVRLSRAENVEHLSQSINGRINALSLTHRLLAERHWQSVSLTELIDQQLAAQAVSGRVVVEGHAVELVPEIVQPLGLVIHELISNACVHGALATDTDVVKLQCSLKDGALVINWREPVHSFNPEMFKQGFGLQIVETVVEHQLGGSRKFSVANDMLETTIVVPSATVKQLSSAIR